MKDGCGEKVEMILDRRFDPRSWKHFMNGDVQVLHCHHYSTLYTQLADDCGMLDAKKLLKEVAEDTFFNTMSKYFTEHEIYTIQDRISIVEQYYSVCGLAK
ncbi:MAG: hypothetical protein ACUVRS_04000 [Armatimonadota bacterium]